MQNNYDECKAQYQELVLKHNRTISENEERKNSDHKIVDRIIIRSFYFCLALTLILLMQTDLQFEVSE